MNGPLRTVHFPIVGVAGSRHNEVGHELKGNHYDDD